MRYQSYPNYESFKKDVMDKNPKRFEVGPVYSANPRERKTIRKAAFKPIAKELVFDIDLTDYDSIRTCCQDKKICTKCWEFITLAIKILDCALREDFGFKHILWVYSGRRGAHAWVCDKRARDLDDSKRRAIATYLQVIGGSNTSGGKAVSLPTPWHPHFTRSFEVLNAEFPRIILNEQDSFSTKSATESIYNAMSDKAFVAELKNKWDGTDVSSTEKWKNIDELARSNVSKMFTVKTSREVKKELIFEFLYPRLDINVTRGTNHLLKSPFCIHPDTGRICVPIDADNFENFNPLEVPTVHLVLKELEDFQADSDQSRMNNYEKTSLKPYMEVYNRFVNNLMKDELHNKRQLNEEDENLEF
ncbi:DNA primase small subunit [Trichomonascus vanleenenianus]|uniref:DNA primase subunit PRI1 n=1 Tax=Trichomonascus vanleenenianus TaxID=2268995 RepID=UPI003EC9C192